MPMIMGLWTAAVVNVWSLDVVVLPCASVETTAKCYVVTEVRPVSPIECEVARDAELLAEP